MKSYFLDTSIIIDFLRNKAKIFELVDKLDGDLTSNYICLAELFEGVSRIKNHKPMEKTVIAFFESLNHIYGIDYEIAKLFGQIRAHLKQQGQVIEDIDIIIAATCIRNSEILVTQNIEHYRRIPYLDLYTIK